MEKLAKIRDTETLNKFYYWLAEHPEITRINGYDLDRRDSGSVCWLLFDGGKHRHTFDAAFIWAERKMLNDWIDAYNKGYGVGNAAAVVESVEVETADPVGFVVYCSWVDHDNLTGSQCDSIESFPTLDAAISAAADRQADFDEWARDFGFPLDMVYFVVCNPHGYFFECENEIGHIVSIGSEFYVYVNTELGRRLVDRPVSSRQAADKIMKQLWDRASYWAERQAAAKWGY